MIAIKQGTVSWRQTDTLAADEVQFTGAYLYESDGVTPNMVWDSGINNVRQRTEAERAASANVVAVPASVTMRQARLALLGLGLLTQVTTAISALPEPQKTAALITWEYSGEVQRDFGLVVQMADALGMTSAQIDALFIAAAAL